MLLFVSVCFVFFRVREGVTSGARFVVCSLRFVGVVEKETYEHATKINSPPERRTQTHRHTRTPVQAVTQHPSSSKRARRTRGSSKRRRNYREDNDNGNRGITYTAGREACFPFRARTYPVSVQTDSRNGAERGRQSEHTPDVWGQPR